MSDQSEKPMSSLIVVDSVPHIGTLFGLWAIDDYVQNGYHFVRVECVCYSLNGISLRKLDEQRFEISSRAQPSSIAMNEHCKRVVKQTLGDFVASKFEGQYVPPLPYIEPDDPNTFLKSLIDIGVGATTFDDIRNTTFGLAAILPPRVSSVAWPRPKLEE